MALGLLAAVSAAHAAPQIERPTIKAPSSFAIVVDRTTYDRTGEAVRAYRDIIESDGLAAYIISDEWGNPEELRSLLQELHNDARMPLEGAVFVGDIPIPMLRDAQALTSAFKMDQTRDWKDSSVPSDRFYDDFDLKFDFIRQDEDIPAYYYFSLSPDGPQYLESDIYTARIRPMAADGRDPYEQIGSYLRKVVAERGKGARSISDLTVIRGHGYNSEALEAWAGEHLALREQLPAVFSAGNRVRFYDFESRYPMKPYILTEIQRTEADMILFHHHGSNDVQYINGNKTGSDPNTSMFNLKYYLRSKVYTARRRGLDVEALMDDYSSRMDVPRHWLEEAADPKNITADSIYNADMDIVGLDIRATRPNARFVMFDACYNGSFYEDDNIAGSYIFGSGTTIVTQGNTVNTIQDKWPDRYLGLLGCGVRVGQWHRHVQFLETHIVGDPTYRFADDNAPGLDLNRLLATREGDARTWLRLLRHASPDVRCIALRKLFAAGYPGIGQICRDTYFASASAVERMECMVLLVEMQSEYVNEVLPAAAGDSYELVRRMCMKYTGQFGRDEMLPALISTLLDDRVSARVSYQAGDALKLMDPAKARAEIERQLAAADHWADKEELRSRLLKSVERIETSNAESRKEIFDTEMKPSWRRMAITTYRNNPVHANVDRIIEFVDDAGQDLNLRVMALEALSWFTRSPRRGDIIEACKRWSASPEESLAREARRTSRRLTDGR